MIVLDCNAAVHIINKTSQGDALQLLIEPDETIIAPDLFYAEAASTYVKYVRAGLMSKEEAIASLSGAARLVTEFVPLAELYSEAFHEAVQLNHSVYDLVYLTLARRKSATLATLDNKLLKLCEAQGIDCIHQVKGQVKGDV